VALAKLPARIERAVCVVADRCVDDTAELARAEFAGWRNARVLPNDRADALGDVRDLGFRHVATMIGRPRAERLLLSTDADTEVDPDWALAHLRLAEQGWHAIAGVAELAAPLPAPVAARYASVRGAAHGPAGHGNVYGANLGVRADAYAAVGGFAPFETGEDRDLWRRLGAADFRCTYATEPLVRTSARQNGRAPDGVAALLRRLLELPSAS
jgi:hypothetical protein